MDYILEEIDSYGRKVKCNYLIQDNRISYISDHSLKMNLMRVSLNHFLLKPGHVMADFSIYDLVVKGEKLTDCLNNLVQLGCTTLLTTFPIYYERDFHIRLSQLRNIMKEGQLDYVIGLSIPVRKLTPKIIRKCQREKLPFISVQIDEVSEINSIVWEWIRDANFPYNVQIIPEWKKKIEGKGKKQALQTWEVLMKEKSIETISDFPGNQSPLSKSILKQLGIYPRKGEFVIGADIDYLLYFKEQQDGILEESNSLHYHTNKEPEIVVKDGDIIKLRQNIFSEKGNGNELRVNRPGIFKSL
jgi:hypothetical protein